MEIDTGDSATTPALANLDGDSELEIVIYDYTIGKLKAYNCGNATPFIDVSIGPWTPEYTPNPPISAESWPCSPGLADITEDGVTDIVIHNGKKLYCINGLTHAIEWTYSGDRFFGSPVMSDLDSDNHLEIVVTGKPDSAEARLKIEMVEHTGTLKFKWWATLDSTGTPDPSLNEACLSDVDADGDLEIIGVDYSCWLVCLDCEHVGIYEDEDLDTQHNIRIMNTVIRDKVELILPCNEAYQPSGIEYSVYNLSGSIVQKDKVYGSGGKITIDVATLKTGIYFLKLKSLDNHTFKLVKILQKR